MWENNIDIADYESKDIAHYGSEDLAACDRNVIADCGMRVVQTERAVMQTPLSVHNLAYKCLNMVHYMRVNADHPGAVWVQSAVLFLSLWNRCLTL